MTRLELGGYAGAGILAALAIVAVLTPVGAGGEKSIVGPVRPAKGAIVALDPERQTEIERLAQSFVIGSQTVVTAQAAADRVPTIVAVARIRGRGIAYVETEEGAKRVAIGQSYEGWRLLSVTANSAIFEAGGLREVVKLFRGGRASSAAPAAGQGDAGSPVPLN